MFCVNKSSSALCGKNSACTCCIAYTSGGQPLARVPNLAREHFYPARERGLGNEILPPSDEKVNNLQGAVLSDEPWCPFLHFSL